MYSDSNLSLDKLHSLELLHGEEIPFSGPWNNAQPRDKHFCLIIWPPAACEVVHLVPFKPGPETCNQVQDGLEIRIVKRREYTQYKRSRFTVARVDLVRCLCIYGYVIWDMR